MAIQRPTFSESWYRVADLKAKLRSSAQISRQFYRGERWYVLRDPAGNQYHRLSAPAYQFIGLLDGKRTVSEAWELVGGQMADDAPTQNEVIQILSQLHSANLIESNVTPDAAVLLNRYKKFQRQRLQSRLMNVLFPRIPLWDCDQFLKRWMPVMRIVLSTFGIFLWFGMVIWAAVSVAPRWEELWKSADNATDPKNWPLLWLTFVLIKLIHELGHSFLCRRFGGEVHEMGVMFLVLMPAPYVDASSAWAFPSRWHRMLVGMGGMIFELFVASILAFVWLNTSAGTIHSLAYNAMLIASVSTVVFNANPLLRYDGYYILADWLEIPNLRYRSTEYTMGLIKRHLFRVKQHQPLPPISQRFWLFLYAVSSSIYRTFIGLAIIFIVYKKAPIIGPLMALGGVATWVIVPVVKTARYLLIDPELHRKRTGAIAWTLGFLALVVFVLAGFKMQTHYETQGIVEAKDLEHLLTRSAGKVVAIEKKDGDLVKKGDVILRSDNFELNSQRQQYEARVAQLSAQWDGYYNEPNLRKQVEQERQVYIEELAKVNEQIDRLVLRAPIDGELVSPDLRHLEGMWIQEGQEIGKIIDPASLRIIACIDQEDGAQPFIREVKKARVQLAADLRMKDASVPVAMVEDRAPSPLYELPNPALGHMGGGPIATDPSDPKGLKLTKPMIQLWLNLENPDGKIVPGQRVHVRFDIDKQPLVINWSRRLWQTIKTYTNSKWM